MSEDSDDPVLYPPDTRPDDPEDKTAQYHQAALRDGLTDYDNLESFYDSDSPPIHRFRIVNLAFSPTPPVVTTEVDGKNLAVHLREYLLGSLKNTAEVNLLELYEAADWESVRTQLTAEYDFPETEYAMYYFFIRNLPGLFVRMYNILLFMTVISEMRRMQDEREKRQSEANIKEQIGTHIAQLEKEIYRILDATSRGRPPGSTKSEEQKAQDAADFERQIEEAIRFLIDVGGAFPTKTAVAKALGIGGLSPRTGTDSSLTSFNNKLKRLGIEYDKIVSRVKGLNKK